VNREVISVEEFPGEIGLPAKGELPIPDYEHLPQYSIESRVASLARDDVEILLRYESEHRNRTPVLRLLTERVRELRARDRLVPPQGGYGPPSPYPPDPEAAVAALDDPSAR
jgi:hypothetical protein